jgi:hypothetical protein
MRKGGEKMVKKYQKPTVATIQIPERTAYACNLGNAGCPHISNVVNHGVCNTSTNGIFGLGQCN